MSTQTATQTGLSATMTKIDKVVRESHAEREGHTAEGYWTERTESRGTMQPRKFVPTCCGKR